MKRARKQQIRQIFAVTEPKRKREFFRQRQMEPMHTGQLILQQFPYLSKGCRAVSVLVLCLAICMKKRYPEQLLELFLAMMPFLAMTSVFEVLRSRYYGMQELEMTCRFSLKSILFVRMEIVGLENLFVGIFLAFLLQSKFFQAVAYLFVPYLMTTYGCLLLTRKCAERERGYLCLGCAVLISGLMLITVRMPWIYQEKYLAVWFGAATVMLLLVLKELSVVVRLTESYE